MYASAGGYGDLYLYSGMGPAGIDGTPEDLMLKSQTAKRERARNEVSGARHASDTGAGPRVYHTRSYFVGESPGGRNVKSYILMQAYPLNATDFFRSLLPAAVERSRCPRMIKRIMGDFWDDLYTVYTTLASDGIFCMDVKLDNVVVECRAYTGDGLRTEPLTPSSGDVCRGYNLKVRVIDFDRCKSTFFVRPSPSLKRAMTLVMMVETLLVKCVLRRKSRSKKAILLLGRGPCEELTSSFKRWFQRSVGREILRGQLRKDVCHVLKHEKLAFYMDYYWEGSAGEVLGLLDQWANEAPHSGPKRGPCELSLGRYTCRVIRPKIVDGEIEESEAFDYWLEDRLRFPQGLVEEVLLSSSGVPVEVVDGDGRRRPKGQKKIRLYRKDGEYRAGRAYPWDQPFRALARALGERRPEKVQSEADALRDTAIRNFRERAFHDALRLPPKKGRQRKMVHRRTPRRRSRKPRTRRSAVAGRKRSPVAPSHRSPRRTPRRRSRRR